MQDEANQEDSEQNDIDGMKKGADGQMDRETDERRDTFRQRILRL